jgi:hypothetical protein
MKVKLQLLLTIFIFFILINNLNAQVATKYSFTQTAGTYTAISGGTVLWSGTFDNEVSDPIAIPTFMFDGELYTSLFITSNGFLTFGTEPLDNNFTPISNTAIYKGAISAFGRDVSNAESGSPEVRYQQVGNEFIIQWQDVRRLNIAGEIISFQIRLNTSDNSIKVVYGGTITSGSNTTYPQVGLRGPNNTFATNVNNRTIAAAGGNWINSGNGISNASTMYFNSATPATVPSPGLTYTWTPGNYPPSISYATLKNTTNIGNRALNNVSIIDADGAVAGGAFAPRVYWKVGASGSWSSSATSSSSNPYNFTILTTGLSKGDSVFYFVIAQDDLGEVRAVPGNGLVATNVNTVSSYPTNPNYYVITDPPLSGDYFVGTSLFRLLTGENITFEKRIRSVEKIEMVNENSLNQEKEERGEINELAKDIEVRKVIEEEYYVPMLDDKEYTGSLYHEFTREEKAQYNLDGAGTYLTITAAKNDLNLRGVSGSVKLILINATYPSETYPIVIGEIDGTNSSTTVTMLPNTAVTTTFTINAATPIFDLSGCSYFIIDGRQNGIGATNSINLINNSTASNASAIRFINGSTNNTIKYVNVTCMPSTSTNRMIEFSTAASGPTGNSDNLITNCDLNGARYGIYFNGTLAYLNSGNVISNSKIYNSTFAQFFFSSNSSSTTLEGNEIYNTTSQGTANSAMQVNAGNFGTNNVRKNKIYDIQNSLSAAVRSIYLIGSGSGSVWNIENNFISMTLNNGTKTTHNGIDFGGANSYTMNVYYNTVRLGGSNAGGTSGNVVSSCIFKNTTNLSSSLNAKDNIFINERTGGNAGVIHAGANYNNLAGTMDVNYNCYFADGSPVNAQVRWSGTNYNNLSDYKTAVNPQEQNSIFKSVSFVSNTDLHLIPPSSGDLDLSGTPITGITTDIDGEPRNEVVPYMGADESFPPLPVELTSFTASIDRRDVHLNWTTASEMNNSGFIVERTLVRSENTPAEWINTGFVEGNGTTNETQNYSFTDRGLNSGKYNYRLKQIDYNGNFEYFNLSGEVVIGVPDKFDLSQNYPNPFNPTTKINFDLPFDSKVMMKIFDITGREIITLVNEVHEAGYYTVTFDSKGIASGVYFYRIIAEGNSQQFVKTKRMILVR